MKQIILIASLLMAGGLWANDMDSICVVEVSLKSKIETTNTLRSKKCVRNNIVSFIDTQPEYVVAKYCRFDREINIIPRKVEYSDSSFRETFDVSCVLYSTEGRNER